MITKEEYDKCLSVCYAYKRQIESMLYSVKEAIREVETKYSNVTPETDLMDVEIKVRTINVVRASLSGVINTRLKVKHLSHYKITEWRKMRYCGDRTITEIEMLCACAGVELKL